VRRLRNLIEQNGFKVHFPVEIRFVKGDDIWLSPAYGGDKCYIGKAVKENQMSFMN